MKNLFWRNNQILSTQRLSQRHKRTFLGNIVLRSPRRVEVVRTHDPKSRSTREVCRLEVMKHLMKYCTQQTDYSKTSSLLYGTGLTLKTLGSRNWRPVSEPNRTELNDTSVCECECRHAHTGRSRARRARSRGVWTRPTRWSTSACRAPRTRTDRPEYSKCATCALRNVQ